MKSAYGCTDGGTALYALLASQLFVMADLFKFTLADGTILRYTSFDGDLPVMEGASPSPTGPYTYSSVGPYLTRGPTRIVIGLEVDTLQVNFLINSGVLIGSIPLAQFAAQGGFDGARVELDRAFLPAPSAPGSTPSTAAGYLIQFLGRVAEVDCTRVGVTMNVNSDIELLNVMLPRNVYQAGCRHKLYDAGCTLSKAAFTVASAAAAGSTAIVINSAIAAVAGYYNLGVITFTSGANNGLSRTVKNYTPGVHTLAFPLPVAPAIGDTFTTYPGCDKQQSTCLAKFANLSNFGGHPYIPSPETSY